MSLPSFSITFCNDILDPLSRKEMNSKGLSSVIAETGEDSSLRANQHCIPAVASIAIDSSGHAMESDVNPTYIKAHQFYIELKDFSMTALDESPIDDDGSLFYKTGAVNQISGSSMFTRK